MLEISKSNVNIPADNDPIIVPLKGLKARGTFGYATKSKQAKGLVVHYTVSNRTNASAKQVLKGMIAQKYACMVMDENGIIYIPEGFDIFKTACSHAGKSAWLGTTGVSKIMMGMEICNWGSDGPKRGAKDLRKVAKKNANQKPGTYQMYTPKQEKALINFCLWAKKKNPEFSFDFVAGHDEVAPTRKSDPGGSLSMTMPAFRELLKKKV